MVSRSKLHQATAGALAAAFVAFGSAHAAERVVNGVRTHEFPAVGALLYGGTSTLTATTAMQWCSGTMVGCRTFLTAAHCVYRDRVASHYWVYLQHGGLRRVASVATHPSYDPYFSANDVAVLKLEEDVGGVEPAPFNATHDLGAMGVGLEGTVVGFGRTGSSEDYGLKRFGRVRTAACDLEATWGEGDDVLVCWNYDEVVGPAGEDSNSCSGDSGGPLFMDLEGTGRPEVVGVTAAGMLPNCGPGDHSWDAGVYHNSDWLASQMGDDGVADCGGMPAVGHADVAVHHFDGALSSANAVETMEFTVDGAPRMLRVTLNGTDDGAFNPDLYVKRGPGAGPAAFDCKTTGAMAFGACEFPYPELGEWSVAVVREAGGGDYQVTATVFGGDPSVCGDGAATGGEDCDGTDDARCPGACFADCSCPAPTCGDGVATMEEACDGADDAACPGECNSECACPAVCSRGSLQFLRFRVDADRFSYKGVLLDRASLLDTLDPCETPLEFTLDDGLHEMAVAVPAHDAGWVRADRERRLYAWKGDGSLPGLSRVRLAYHTGSMVPYWTVMLRGRKVPGAGALDLARTLEFRLGMDGTCHLQGW